MKKLSYFLLCLGLTAFGADQVTVVTAGNAKQVQIHGDSARAIYDSLTQVPEEETPFVGMVKRGDALTCAHTVTSGPRFSEGYRCAYQVSSNGKVNGAELDPCAERELPPCPPACAADAFQNCGKPCQGDAACGNSIGDGMTCVGGRWSCSIHAPLGLGCNLVCRG